MQCAFNSASVFVIIDVCPHETIASNAVVAHVYCFWKTRRTAVRLIADAEFLTLVLKMPILKGKSDRNCISLSTTPWRHAGDVETNVLVFSTSPVDGSEWSDSLSSRLTVPWKRLPTAIDWDVWSTRAVRATDSCPLARSPSRYSPMRNLYS
jgi:hypothetical protein